MIRHPDCEPTVSDIQHLYPPSPAHVPADLTTPPKEYRLRVLVVLASLFVFLIVYLALTVGMAAVSFWCFSTLVDPQPVRVQPAPAPYNPRTSASAPRRSSRNDTSRTDDYSSFWLVVGGGVSALICVFMVKGFFKRSGRDDGIRHEITEKDEPELFAFIRKLCHDTRAPFPHRIYAVPDVNAAVAYNESILNLFLPAKKNLILGLGLVNRLNLAEFKAVLAHEFGHFSQKSMKIGTYVYTSNRVIADVVYGRDALDDFIWAMTRIDLRISVFAWGFAGILWLTRKLLEGLFRAINFAKSSLSRQMEYNADLVAVSVTGSDSLIFALARLDFAGETLGQAWADLMAAADHGRYTRDIYFHQSRMADYLRMRRGNPMLGEVPPLPDDPNETVRVFAPEDLSVPAMWATHPANHDREVNAKARYIRSPMDDRPAWVLFRNGAAIRESVSRQMYERGRKEKPGEPEDPEAVQAFIDAEHAETSYHPRYLGLYDNRLLQPGDLVELREASARREYEDPARLEAAFTSLYASLPERMALHKSRIEELDKLAPIAHGGMALRGSDFEHRGRRHSLADAKRLFKDVQEELDADYKWMHALDREVYLVHSAMAAQLGGDEPALLDDRYRFHLELQNLFANLRAHNDHVQSILASISGQRQLHQQDFQNALAGLREARTTLSEQLAIADDLKLPALTNIEAGKPLGQLLLSEKLVKKLPADTQSLSGEWIGQFLRQMGEVLDRSGRMLFKSLGGLLAHEEALSERWAAARAAKESLPPRE